MTKVICVSGKAQHGKDTVAKVLCSTLSEKGYRVLVTHYADLLKYICKTFFGWDGQKNEGGRRILQYVGTDVVRQHQPDFWVNFIVSILELFGDNWDYVIIPDTRFPNEITTMGDSFETYHIRVVRPEFVSTLTPEQLNHPSETSLDGYPADVIIENSGTIEDLRQQMLELRWL